MCHLGPSISPRRPDRLSGSPDDPALTADTAMEVPSLDARTHPTHPRAAHVLLPRADESHLFVHGVLMAKGDQSSYSDKQKRQAEHIEEGYEKRGKPKKEAERRAWGHRRWS